MFNSLLSLGNTAPPKPPQLKEFVSIVADLMILSTTLLTSSTTEYESHNRKHRLQLSSLDHPYDRHNDYGDSNQYSYDSEFLSP